MRTRDLVWWAIIGGLLAILSAEIVLAHETLHPTCVGPTTGDIVFAWLATPVLMCLRSFNLQASTYLLIQIAYGTLLGLAAGALVEHRCNLRKRRTDECRICGYNLTPNVSGICPECGQAVQHLTETASTT